MTPNEQISELILKEVDRINKMNAYLVRCGIGATEKPDKEVIREIITLAKKVK